MNIQTLAELKTRVGTHGTSIVLVGGTVLADALANLYVWDQTSTATSDDLNVVQVTGINQGRWLKLLQTGSADNTQVIQNQNSLVQTANFKISGTGEAGILKTGLLQLKYNTGTGTGTSFYIGSNVGNNNANGTNIIIGKDSYLTSNVAVTDNIAIGYNNLTVATAAAKNITIGPNVMGKATTASNNVGVGSGALFELTTGNANFAFGVNALNKLTTGGFNLAIGTVSGQNLTTGGINVFLGNSSGNKSTTANNNTFIGGGAGYNNTTGNTNVYIGYEAGYNQTTASDQFIVSNSRNYNLIQGDFISGVISFKNGVVFNADGTVSGLNATANNHFVTKSQLDAVSNNATVPTLDQVLAVNNYESTKFLANSGKSFSIESVGNDIGDITNPLWVDYDSAEAGTKFYASQWLVQTQAKGFEDNGTNITSKRVLNHQVSEGGVVYNVAVDYLNGDYTTASFNVTSLGTIFFDVQDNRLVKSSTNIELVGEGHKIGGIRDISTITTGTQYVLLEKDGWITKRPASEFGTGGSVDLSNYVDKTTSQTISGTKTFSNDIIVNTIQIGAGSGSNTTSTVVGKNSLQNNNTGVSNTAFGVNSLSVNTTGSYNLALGANSLENSNANNNLAIGYNTGKYLTSGSGNTLLGNNLTLDQSTESALTNTLIVSNGIGERLIELKNARIKSTQNSVLRTYTIPTKTNDDIFAMLSDIPASVNPSDYIQNQTSVNQNASFKISGVATVGSMTFHNIHKIWGGNNVATTNNIGIGSTTLNSVTTGQHIIAIGSSTLQNVTTADYTVGIGSQVLTSLTTGGFNTAIGNYSMQTATNATHNVAVGHYSLNGSNGSRNVALGSQAGYNSTSSDNVFIGYQTGQSLTGGSNTLIGSNMDLTGRTSMTNTLLVAAGGVNILDLKNLTIKNATNSTTRTYTIPAKGADDTFAMLSDLSGLGSGNLSNYVPYTGATSGLNLGTQTLSWSATNYTSFMSYNGLLLGDNSLTNDYRQITVLPGEIAVSRDTSSGGGSLIRTTIQYDGVILQAPNGTRYKVTVQNGGSLTTTIVT